MRGEKICPLLLCLFGMAFLIVVFQPIWAGEVVLRSVQIEKPIAILLEVNGYGELERDGKTYTINAAGAGFRKGDIFSVPISGTGDHYAVIALNKAVKEEDTSYVRLEEGAKIVFLDDDGKVAITGVYVESTSSSTPSSLVFYINHASSGSPFFIWAPDLVVGVRGTYFEVKPADAELHYKTQVVGYNAIDGSEVVTLAFPTPGQFNPDDLRLILANAEIIIDFLKTNLPNGSTIPSLVGGDDIPVNSLNPHNTYHVIAAYYYMVEHYAFQLEQMLNDTGNPLNLGVDVTKVANSVSITYHQPNSYLDGFINKIFSNAGGDKPVVVDFNTSFGPPKLKLSVTYLMTDNLSCVSSGGTCTYDKYKIGSTTTLYDVLMHNQNIANSAFRDLVLGLMNTYGSFFNAVGISVVPGTPGEIKILGCKYKLGWFCSGGECKILKLVEGEGTGCASLAILANCVSKLSSALQAIDVEYFMAVDTNSDHNYLRLYENSDTVVLTKPGVKFSIRIEKDSSGHFVYPLVKVGDVGMVPVEKKSGTLKETFKKFNQQCKEQQSEQLEKADQED